MRRKERREKEKGEEAGVVMKGEKTEKGEKAITLRAIGPK